ncbi:MAG TPA: hypothetical protein VM915_00250, partial [Verrucomicrobiae bacterium]|nr:hypothetical protein [Verrucomicrobiae bacterium]
KLLCGITAVASLSALAAQVASFGAAIFGVTSVAVTSIVLGLIGLVFLAGTVRLMLKRDVTVLALED